MNQINEMQSGFNATDPNTGGQQVLGFSWHGNPFDALLGSQNRKLSLA